MNNLNYILLEKSVFDAKMDAECRKVYPLYSEAGNKRTSYSWADVVNEEGANKLGGARLATFDFGSGEEERVICKEWKEGLWDEDFVTHLTTNVSLVLNHAEVLDEIKNYEKVEEA